jgi:hypothetical protein
MPLCCFEVKNIFTTVNRLQNVQCPGVIQYITKSKFVQLNYLVFRLFDMKFSNSLIFPALKIHLYIERNPGQTRMRVDMQTRIVTGDVLIW